MSAAVDREDFFVDGLTNTLQQIAQAGECYEIEYRAKTAEQEQRLRALVEEALTPGHA